MAQFNGNAQPQPQNKNEYVAHQFHVNAHFDANAMNVTIKVNDAITSKKWELTLDENDYNDIKGTYDKIKVAVDQSKMAVSFPDEGKPLELVLMTQPNYMPFELPETK